MNEFLLALGLMMLNLFILYIAYLLWLAVWFNPFGAEIPIDQSAKHQERTRTKVYAQTKTISIFRSMIYSLIRKLDMEYWATHCGNDGYLYLLFQRRFLKLSIYYSII